MSLPLYRMRNGAIYALMAGKVQRSICIVADHPFHRDEVGHILAMTDKFRREVAEILHGVNVLAVSTNRGMALEMPRGWFDIEGRRMFGMRGLLLNHHGSKIYRISY